MGLAPSTLFHLTNKRALKGILSDNFKIKYCVEYINEEEHRIIGVPMVSFCDIKISEIKDHILKYGEYGIGLKKEWADKKGLNPVMYLNRNSHFSKSFIENIMSLKSNKNLSPSTILKILDPLRYIKAYEGTLKRKGENTFYRFADEREWRYVPDLTNRKFMPFLSGEVMNDKAKRENHTKRLRNERLYFNANDILYVIVKKESEIEEIISHIRDVKSDKYSMMEVERLMTRIISVERIMNDF